MEYSLREPQRSFRHRFEQFCQGSASPRAREADRRGVLPPETWKDLREVGYLRLFHPPELGGTGADTVTCALAIESLSQACGIQGDSYRLRQKQKAEPGRAPSDPVFTWRAPA